MTQRSYDAATAKALFEMAFQGWELLPYVVRDDGIYPSNEHRDHSPLGTAFDWTPAYDMEWPGAPNPANAPMLPIPFTAGELAACMLDGAGSSIQELIGRRLGYALEADDLEGLTDRQRWVRDALCEAYALAVQAQKLVGEFDYDEQEAAHKLLERYGARNGQANQREMVFEKGITNDEARLRRARAVQSVAKLKKQAQQALGASEERWRAWRKAMVQHLLGNDQSIQPPRNTRGWVVVTPKRLQGYGPELLRLLTEECGKGSSRPTAREVIERWRVEKPVGIAAVLADEIKYFDSNGNIKAATLDAIRQAIVRMTVYE